MLHIVGSHIASFGVDSIEQGAAVQSFQQDGVFVFSQVVEQLLVAT